MDKLETIHNYFSVLETTGYLSQGIVNKTIVSLALQELLEHPYPIMNCCEYEYIKATLQQILDCNCLTSRKKCCNGL